MAGNNDFNILLIAMLDESSAAITDLNRQIERIAAKLDPVKLKVDIDSAAVNTLIANIEKIQQVSEQMGKSSAMHQHGVKKALNDTAEAAQQAEEMIQKMGKALKTVNTYTIDKAGKRKLEYKSRYWENVPGIQRRVDTDGTGNIVQDIVTDKTEENRKKEAIKAAEKAAKEAEIARQRQIKAIMDAQRKYQKDYEKTLNEHYKDVSKAERQREVELKDFHDEIIANEEAFNREYNKVLFQHGKDVENSLNTIDKEQYKFEQDNQKKAEKAADRVKSLGTKKADVNFLDTDTDLEKMVKAEQALRGLYGSKLDLRKLAYNPSKDVYEYIAAVKTGKDKFLEYKGSVDLTTKALYENGMQAKNTLTRNLGFFDKLKVALSQVPTWMAAMTVFYGSLRAFQQGIKNIAEIDGAMVDLRKVTNETAETYQSFALEANRTGIELGKSTVEVIKATAEFARLGYTLNQAKALSREALVFSTVGDVDVQTASQTLISAIKGFGITVDEEGKNVRKVVDVYNEVGNNFAISSAGISEAVKRSASSMKESGNTLEETVALVTAANSVVQDPEQVGTALKTVAMRLRGVDEEGEKIKDLGPQVEGAFKRVGLSVLDANGNFKSTFQILKELSGIWNKLGDMDKSNLLEQVAGKRQGNIVAAILQNWTDAEKSLQMAMNSTGSAAKEHAAAMDSVEGRLNTFKNTVTGLWQDSINTEGMKDAINIGTSWIQVLHEVVNALGLLPTAIGAVAAAYAMLNTSGKTGILKGWIESIYLTSQAGSAAELATAKILGFNTAEIAMGNASVATALKVNILKFAISSLNTIVTGFVGAAVFMALGYALQWVVGKWQESKRAEEEARKALEDTVKTYGDNKETIRSLVDEYDKLSKIQKDGALGVKEQERLVEVQDQLGKLLPDVAEKFDAQGHAILKTADAIKAYVGNIDLLQGVKDKETKNNFELSLAEREKKLNDLNDKIAKAKEEQGSNTAFVQTYSETGPVSVVKDTQMHLEDEKALIALEKQKAELVENWSIDYANYVKASLNGANVLGQLTKADMEYLKVEALKAAQQKANNGTSETHLQIVQKLEKQYRAIADARKLATEPVDYGKFIGVNEQGVQIYDTVAYRISKVREALDAAGVSYDQQKRVIDQVSGSLWNLGENLEHVHEKEKKTLEGIDSFVSSQKDLAGAIDDLNDGEKLSLDTIIKLVGKYPSLLGELDKEGNAITLHKDALVKLAQVREAEFKAEMLRNIQEAENSTKLAKTKVENAEKELKALKAVAEFKAKTASIMDNILFPFGKPKNQPTGPNPLDPYLSLTPKKPKLTPSQESQLSSAEAVKAQQTYNEAKAAYDESQSVLDELKKGYDVINSIDWTSMLGDEKDKKKKDKKPVIPYDLKDYEHQDKILANIIEDLKYQMKPYDGKFDEASMKKIRDLVQQQVNQYRARISLANNADVGLPSMQNEANDMLAKYNSETDQELKNEYGRKYDEITDKILKVKNSIKDWEEAIRHLLEVTDEEKYKIDTVKKAMEELDDEVELSKANMRGLEKESQMYRDELEKQNKILDKKRDLVQTEISSLEKLIVADQKLLETEGLLESQKNALIERIDKNSQALRESRKEYAQLTDEIYSNVAAIKESKKEWFDKTAEIADKVVEGVKAAYEKQKDLVIKAIDETLKAEEKAHDQKVKMLDEEGKKYDEIINSRMKALDQDWAKDDFEKNLRKAQDERDKIKTKIDLLGMDNSPEAQAKLADLRKQLKEKDDAIADMKQKRDRELRKDNLQEQAEAKKKELDNAKKTEDDKLEKTKETLEKMKQEQEKYYNDILEDEAKWQKMRKDIMEGNTKDVIAEINKLSGEFQKVGNGDFSFLKDQLGTYWTTFTTITQTNLASLGVSLKTYLSQATALKELIEGTKKPGDTNNTGGLDQVNYGDKPDENKTAAPTAEQRKKDRDTYLQNKMNWWAEYATTGNTNSENQKKWAKENSDFRANPYYKDDPEFKDYNKDELETVMPEFKNFLTDFREYIKVRMEFTNPDTSVDRRMEILGTLLDLEKNWINKWGPKGIAIPRFSYDEIISKGLDKFDTGGYTGVWGSSNGDGKLAMLHQKEIVLNANDTSNLLKVIQAVRAIIPQISLPFSKKESGSVIIQKVEMRIGSVEGGKKGAETLLEMFVDGLREKGVKP